MKVFQIVKQFCYWDATATHPTLESIGAEQYPPDVLFAQAPDYVREGWGYDNTQTGDARFVQPEPPEGWLYDAQTGTFYEDPDYSAPPIDPYEAYYQGMQEVIANA